MHTMRLRDSSFTRRIVVLKDSTRPVHIKMSARRDHCGPRTTTAVAVWRKENRLSKYYRIVHAPTYTQNTHTHTHVRCKNTDTRLT